MTSTTGYRLSTNHTPAPPAVTLSRKRRRLLSVTAAGALACGALVSLGSVDAPVASASQPAVSGALSLISQTPVLTGTNPFSVSLSVTSSLPSNKLELSVVLYPRLLGRSDFEQSLAGTQVSTVLAGFPTATLNELLSSSATSGSGSRAHPGEGLSSAPGPGSGSVSTPAPTAPSGARLSLSLPVTTAPYSSTPDTLTLNCETPTQVCDGVYPIRFSLVDLAGKSLASFTTYLVYGAPYGLTGHPLRLAWVVRLGVSPTTTRSGQAQLTTQDEVSIATVLYALEHNPGVYMNLELYGETVLALEQGARHPGSERTLMSLLRTVTSDQPGTAIIPGTFVPIDLEGFADAGLSSELTNQLARGRSTIEKALPNATLLTSAPAIVASPVNVGKLAMLESVGATSFVLPEDQLAPDSCGCTATEPFRLKVPADSGLSQPQPKAIASDAELPRLFSTAPDQQLAAYQLLADLAEIFFELPNASEPRAVVLLTPDTWRPTKTMLDTLLHGLAAADNAGLITTTSLTSTVADIVSGGNSQPVTRSLIDGGLGGGGANPLTPPVSTSAISSARQAAVALSSLVPTDKGELRSLQTLILGGEASDLSSGAQAALFGVPAAEIAGWGSLVTLPEGNTVTLTSSQGQIPITIESRASIPLHVVLRVSNPQGGIKFPSVTRIPLVLTGRTVANVEVSTRTSGDFSLHIELVTPEGNPPAVIDTANLTVRSTAFSGLAIGLSVGALVLLGGWWIRSTRRRRRARRAEEEAEQSADGESGGGRDAAADDQAAESVRSTITSS